MENKFKVGDLVKGKENNGYGITDEDMTKGRIIGIENNDELCIQIIEHVDKNYIGRIFKELEYERFELIPQNFEVGDKVKIRGDVTLDEIKANDFNGCQINTMEFLSKQSSVFYDHFGKEFKIEDIDRNALKLKGMDKYINEVIFEIVEKHKEEPKEMTVEEISKALGYEIKVVKG